MADKAFMVLEDGSLSAEPIEASKLRPEDFNKRFICCGNGCSAEMVAVHGSPSNYFREYSKLRTQHTFLCPYNEEGAIKKVAHLDHYGKSTTLEKLCDRFGSSYVSGGGTSTVGKFILNNGPGNGGRINAKPIERCARNPRNLKELYLLLATMDLDETYAGQHVSDILLDHRSIDDYRSINACGKRLDNEPAIVICKKVNPQTYNLKPPDYGSLILADAFFYRDHASPIFFSFGVTPVISKQIIHSQKNEVIVLFSRWNSVEYAGKQYMEYVSDPVSPGQILIIDEDKIL
jgi:hypothetical protein